MHKWFSLFLKKLVSEYFLQCYLLNYKLYSNFSIFPLMSLLCQDPGGHVTLCHHVSFNSSGLWHFISLSLDSLMYTRFGNTTKVTCHSWYVMSGAWDYLVPNVPVPVDSSTSSLPAASWPLSRQLALGLQAREGDSRTSLPETASVKQPLQSPKFKDLWQIPCSPWPGVSTWTLTESEERHWFRADGSLELRASKGHQHQGPPNRPAQNPAFLTTLWLSGQTSPRLALTTRSSVTCWLLGQTK